MLNMARKRTMNRMEMRGDYEGGEEERQEGEEEAADEEEEEEGDEEGESEPEEEGEATEEDEEGEAPKPKKKKAAPKKAPAKPRSRAAKQVRMKLVWGVFNNSNQQVDTFPYPKEDEARALAAKLMADKKTTHFVQKVKLPLEVKEEKGKEK
jgi:hypothetical protein